MKKKYFEKFISLVLAIFMVVGAFPLTVFAEDLGISLSAENITIMENCKAVLTAEVTPSEKAYELVWTSNDESIAKVENGVVTAVSKGNTTITAKVDGVEKSCSVSVTDFVSYVSDIHLSEAGFVNTEGTAYEFSQTPAFSGEKFEYSALAMDTYTRTFAWVTLSDDAPSNTVVEAKWTNTRGKETTATVDTTAAKGTFLMNFIGSGIVGNTVVFEVSSGNNIQSYTVEVKRTPSLSGIKVLDENKNNIPLDKTFAVDTEEYSVSTAADKITIEATPFNSDYTVTYNGSSDPTVSLNGEENKISVEVKNSDGYSKTYTVTAYKLGKSKVKFDLSPQNALVFITDSFNERVFADSNGEFELLDGKTYKCVITAKDYVGKEMDYVPNGDATVNVTLEKAPVTKFKEFESSWPSFGYNNKNNIVINRPTPLTKDETALYWANKIGEGMDYGATGVPILVDDYLYCYAGTSIMKIDKMSGEIVKTGVMTGGSSAYAICSLTYAEGLVFVGLNNGIVQAFNAETLESVWIYHDELKGQPNAQITYDDGYIYTGFWKSEDGKAGYVCLSITDEDPNDTDEEKLATWRHVQKGGFYWAGAYIEGDYLYIGSDDGEKEGIYNDAHLLSINKHTGEVVEEYLIPDGGDIRSSVTSYNGKLYFTSKGGYFHEAEYNSKTGDIITVRSLKLENGTTGTAMSTSTPTIYNGRAYVGVSGKGQFTAYSGHNITVIDIDSWSIAYRVPTQGYPQTTGTLTTYYEKEKGYAYIYFFDNYTPGKLRVIADKPGVTEPIMTVEETVNGSTYVVGESVFEPTGELAQYCICTPIIDEDGTLYFKNDSAYLFAVGSAVDYIEVTKSPDKTKYELGEVFDPTGMEVTAYYINGTERDITNYVTYSKEPLTADDKNFVITYENVGSDEKPYDTIQLTISSGYLELTPEKENTKTKIRLSDTIKLDNSIDTDETYFANKPAGGVFYVAILSDIEYDNLELSVDGYLKGQLLDFDPEKYRSIGEKYSVINRLNGEVAEKGSGLTYDKASKLAQQLNDENRVTCYEVKCESYVYVAKITVPQNYGVSYDSGTYKITAQKNGKNYSSAKYTVVTDVSIFEYEYIKWAASGKDTCVEVMSDNARGYSDYLSYKYGYGKGEYAPPEKENPTVISTTAFRSIADKKLVLTCGDGVKITVPEVSSLQRGVNFIYKNTVGEIDSTKKTTTYTLTFYGKQPIASDFTIEWNLGRNYYELGQSFGIKLEEEDIITYYITKDGKYFDEFTVDYMTANLDENIVLKLENDGGTTLGNYSITIKKPADADSAKTNAAETNPNTGAAV